MTTNDLFLFNLWYLATPGSELKAGRMVSKTILGQPILLGRDQQGVPFALRDICPHRGIPLTHGRFDGCEVECCYHGWRFNTKGQCTDIPSLVASQTFSPGRVKVQAYPCKERQGNVWIYMTQPGTTVEENSIAEAPTLPEIGERNYLLFEKKLFQCDIDHAVIGLMDPAHGPFVHQQWWWRSGKSKHEKQKAFGPSELGFKMIRHKPSSNARAYKLLGGEITTEISFRLPGIRIEQIKAGKKLIYGLTTLTPINERQTEIHQFFYSNIKTLKLFTPIMRPFVKAFLKQDHDVIIKQQQGLKHNPPLMLINDADKQARWYYQLKKELQQSQQENRQFKNPVPETTLTWCS